MISCQGMFGTIIACNLDAKYVVLVGNEERFACRFCKKGYKVVKKI